VATPDNPLALPQFETFRDIVAQNIGYFPNISYDRTGSLRHRARIYRDPPAADILYSERALARYIELADLVFSAKQRDSTRLLVGGLLATVGGDLLRRNAFVGLAFLACGFREAEYKKLPHGEIIGTACSGADREEIFPLINLLLPLAHEIGHLPEAQALCPPVILTDELRETYRINYEMVRRFTGHFEYVEGLTNPQSPLNLSILREEAASDYFGVCAMTWLSRNIRKTGDEYPLGNIAGALLTFPLVMGLEALCFKDLRSTRELQEITLAMQCRYSLIIDSLRTAVKFMFTKNVEETHAEIDRWIDATTKYIDVLYATTWKAFLIYAKDVGALVKLTPAEVLKVVSETAENVKARLGMAEYLSTLSKEVHGYSITPENEDKLESYSYSLRTFDSIILDGEKILLKG
jgi:hypothetical protein